MAALGWGGLAMAQDQPAGVDPLAELLAGSERLPGPNEAIQAYQAVAGAVERWERPGAAPTGAPAVRVTLYRAGVPAGAATARAAVADGGDAVAAAMVAAMEAAERSLLPRRDALWQEAMRALAPDMTPRLELGGPMTPLGEADLADPNAAVRPGLEGIAARVGQEWAIVFPSELTAAGVTPATELAALAGRLLADPTLGVELPRDLLVERGVSFYRFPVVDVAGVGPSGSPRFLVRGQRAVDQREIDVAALVGFAEAMLAHLDAARHPEGTGFGLFGTLRPFHGAAEPLASPTQQTLASLALLSLAATPQAPDATRERARRLARQLMLDLQQVEEGEVAAEDEGVAAAIAWVVLQRLGAERDRELASLWTTCEDMMAAHASAESREVTGTVTSAVLAWAMAERARTTGRDRDVAERDLRAVYVSAEPGRLVGLMPWLGWAELALAPEGPVPAGAALRQVRERAWEHQLTAADAGAGERDLVGGVIFTEGAVALPNWSTTRPVSLCATMLGEPRLTSEEDLPGEVVRLLSAMRFLRQLAAGETLCRFYPDAGLARGGVRVAAWDHRMPPEATAMSLISVSEFLRSLAAREQAKTPPER